MMDGVAADTKDSERIPRLFSYQDVEAGIERTVKTRWSRDLMVAAGAFVDAILKELYGRNFEMGIVDDLLKANMVKEI